MRGIPDKYVNEINGIMWNFIWSGKTNPWCILNVLTFPVTHLIFVNVGLLFLAEPIYKPLVLLKFIFDPETFSWVDRTSIDFF
jgi:hypothetical protein